MKFNMRKTKLAVFLCIVIILSTTLNTTLFSIYNGNVDNVAQDTNEDVFNTDQDGKILISSNSPPNANYFKFYKVITINHNKVSSDLINFTLMISILDADLKSKVQSDGDDIAFSNGTIWLDHEIESFKQNYNPRYARLVAWIRIPSLSKSIDTIIYMYYGNSTMNSRQNPSGAWDINYKGIWHLSEDPGPGYSGDIKDSTSNNNDGTAESSMEPYDQVDGKIDGSIDFDGTDEYITVPDSPNLDGSLNSTGEFTLVAWLYPGNIESFDCIMGSDKIRFCFDHYLYIILYNPNERSAGSSNEVMNENEWQQVVVTYKRTTGSVILYHNGDPVGSGTINNANLDSTIPFYIGEAYWWDFFHGIIDEVRVSNMVRSSQWIETCYENQKDPSSFYSISSRYEINPPEPEEFNFYKKITINHNNISGNNDFIDFPLMISIIDADLHNKVQSDGDDIAFWNGSEWLHHEIEYFSKNYNSYYAKLVAWIRIPILSASIDTVIYMYYGNPTMTSRQDPLGVWGNDYEAVWHLDESSGTGAYIQDSSPNYHDGTPTGTQFLSTGKIDGARNMIGDGDNYIEMDRGSEIFSGNNRFSFSFWIYPNYISDVEWQNYGERRIFESESVWLARIRYSGAGVGDFQADLQWVNHATTYAIASIYRLQWNYITYAYDGTYLITYINGQQDNQYSINGGILESASTFYLGYYNTFKGYFDEFRVMKESRSGDWIETEYNNQHNPTDFYNISRAYKTRVPSPEDFEYFKEITIDADKVPGTEDLIDFPLLISILDSDLKTDAQSNGADILFSNGSDWLEHEIELYNPNYDSTKAQLIVWVRIPILSYNTQTKIYMYYKNSTMQSLENPSGVWDNGYKGIYHLKGDPTQVLLDSTSNNNYGTSGGSMTSTDQVAANIDGGIDLDGSNDYFEISDPLETLVKKDMTISAWIFLKDASDDWISLSQRSDAVETGFDWQFYARASDATPQYHAAYRTNDAGGGSEVVSNITLQTLKWYYLAGKNNGTHNFFYLNGYLTDISEETNSISDSDNDIWFGGNSVWGEYLQGIIDEVRVSNLARSSDWILTEFRNQNNPGTFYSVGPEMTGYSNIQVNALDLYNRPIPSANISIINNTKILQSKIADMYGSVSFTNFPKTKYYNFSVSITSNIQPYQTEIINETSNAILIDTPFYNITLKCNISRNIFYLEDLDGNPLDSGWIVVHHNSLYGSQNLQNCTVDAMGKATFRWLNTSGYHYMVYYQDNNFNPNKIILTSGEIASVNSQINLIVNLTTVNFTVMTFDTKEPVSGVKLLFYNTSSDKSVVNLTTDFNGFASFRWLNTSNFYNYSLRIRFYSSDWQFNMSGINQPDPYVANFSIKAADAYDIEIQITQSELQEYETTLVSLNPKDNLVIEWGLNLTLRALFNVTKAGGLPTGPAYADSMLYEIYLESTIVKSGSMAEENDYIGRYLCTIGTYSLQTDTLYIIKIKGYKSEYLLPTDLQFSLYLLKNDLVLNQSENDDSVQIVYWLEIPEMSVKAYGEVSEEMIIEDNIYFTDGAGNYNFQFSIPDLSMDWNLSQIVFNIYGVTFGVVEQNINLNITDPYGLKHNWDETNADYYYPSGDMGNGAWYNLIITLNKESPTNDNNYNFTIEGTIVGTVQINADAIFRRNTINAEYYESNITDVISIPAYSDNGLVIKNITFEIINCQYLAGGLVDPATVIDNIITNEGYLVSTIYDNGTGYGKITIDDKMIYPLDNIFLFTIGNNTAIIFDVRIKIEYMQEFYKNDYLEVISYSKTVNNFASGDFSIGLTEEDLNNQGAFLYVKDLKVGSDSKYPTEVGMNITILGQTLNISDDPKRGSGSFMLENIMGFTKNKTYFSLIRTKQPVTFSLSFMIMYSRIVVNEIEGTVSYEIKGTDIGGTVQYNEELGFYLQTINTSGIYARYESYIIEFIVTKDHYNSDVKQLELKVLERLTLISGSSANLDLYPVIYIQDELIFNFSYIDERFQTKIIDLETQSYTMTKISTTGQSVPYGSGDLYINSDNEYVFDINTELLAVGTYTIWITLDKQNYESKQAIVFLTINEREIESDLGKMFKEKQVNVVKGKTIILSIELTDPTRGDEPLTDADVILEIGDEEFEFDEVDDGVYELEFDTDKYEAFFTSNTITGTIKISKANYTSEDIDITIVIGMEELEVIPGVIKLPTFYFMLIIAAIIAIVGSLATYRYIQQMKIPKFVKKAGAIRKAIKSSEEIDTSMLYPSKETYMISAVGDKWNSLGLSLESILGLKVKKGKKIIRSMPKIVIPERTADLIPLGLILMKWDPRTGTKILAKYPQDINISQKTLMQVYGTHEYTGESGIITLTVGTLNLLSYYTGPENAYYLILVLNFDDDPDAYEGAMADILRIILQNLEDESYLQLIPSLFQRLSIFPNLTIEGHIAYTYQDEIKRMIINRLREEGVISKSELIVWLKDKYKEGLIDFENILSELMKMEIIKEATIKGIPSELIFLINDPFMLRIPPVQLLENPESHGLPSYLSETYKTEVKKFFQNYHPLEQDNINIIDMFIDPEIYETLKLLRTAIITKNDLEKLKKKGVTDYNRVLRILWEKEIIKVFQDKAGNEYYALLTDFYLDIIFPKYLLNIIKNVYDQKSKDDRVLIEYLKILEDFYIDIKSR